ncbi:unnamed protein product [Acanthocheilonema viteae]|uniref:Uncharacterized protein n=1 Tax=Acanthocheilonema viteae TaxID=6277 RepID=A0A498SI07_ACAVI|nr:unnamed protein product [Acanthocheilonema viteae]
MECQQCKKSNVNKRKVKQNESLPKRKKCNESNDNSVVQQQMNSNTGQNNNTKAVQGATEPTSKRRPINLIIRHFPTFSSSLATAPIARISGPPMISDALGVMRQQTSNNAQRIPLRIARHVSSNQEQDRLIRDISGDKVAEGHLNGQIAVAVPDYREGSNINRGRSDGFRTPLQSSKSYFKYCNDLLMAPKKRHCPRYHRTTEPSAAFMLRLPR